METKAFLDSMSGCAQRKRDEILAAARRDVDAIESDARQRAVASRDTRLAAVRAELESLAYREHERAQADASRAALAMQHEVVDGILQQAGTELNRLSAADAFGCTVVCLLDEAMRVAGRAIKGPLRVLAPPAHVNPCAQWLGEHGFPEITVDASTEADGGVIVEDPRRTLRITNVLASRFGKLEGVARGYCMKKLFGPAS